MKGLLTQTAPQSIRQEGNVTVRVITPGSLRGFLLYPAYRLHFYPVTQDLATSLFDSAYRTSLRQALTRPDILHYSGTGRELIGFSAMQLARDHEIPFVVISHMHRDAWGDGLIDFKLYRQADAYIALTEQEKIYVCQKGLSENRVFVVGHGVNVDGSGQAARIRQKLGIDGPIVLFLGRKAVYKGYPLVLEAAPRVWSQCPNTHFVLAGPDQEGQTESVRASYPSILDDPRIHELGFVSDQEREDLYDAATVYCQPSGAEAYGLAYLEAWAYSTPVVARRIPTMEELVEDQGGGLLTAASSDSVAEAIITLLQNASMRVQMGSAGHQKASRHTWDNVAEQMVQIYRNF